MPCDVDGGGVGISDFLKILGLWGALPLLSEKCPFERSKSCHLPSDAVTTIRSLSVNKFTVRRGSRRL